MKSIRFVCLFVVAVTSVAESTAQSGWFLQNPVPKGDHRGVCFTDVNTGTVVGSAGAILRTTNGGTTWTSQSSGTTAALYGVSFTDANAGTAVGDNGKILHTTNGGTIWTSQLSGTTKALTGVSFTDANTGTAVGLNGTILRTLTGGVTGVEEDLRHFPQQALLSQNYPNPFNPSTSIGYTVAGTGHEALGSSWVKLAVYDLLGREVALLVNEKKVPGSYEVKFDGSPHPSGVYFYRIQVRPLDSAIGRDSKGGAGDFVATRSLLLLK
jgi:hypothetical protein